MNKVSMFLLAFFLVAPIFAAEDFEQLLNLDSVIRKAVESNPSNKGSFRYLTVQGNRDMLELREMRVAAVRRFAESSSVDFIFVERIQLTAIGKNYRSMLLVDMNKVPWADASLFVTIESPFMELLLGQVEPIFEASCFPARPMDLNPEFTILSARINGRLYVSAASSNFENIFLHTANPKDVPEGVLENIAQLVRYNTFMQVFNYVADHPVGIGSKDD